MKNQKLWDERLNELQSYINEHKQLPKSNGGKFVKYLKEVCGAGPKLRFDK